MNELQIGMIVVGILVMAGIFMMHRYRSDRQAGNEDVPLYGTYRGKRAASTPQQRHNQMPQDEEKGVSVIEEDGRKVIIDETLEPLEDVHARNVRFGQPAGETAPTSEADSGFQTGTERADAPVTTGDAGGGETSPAMEENAGEDGTAERKKDAPDNRIFAIMVLGMHYYPFATLHEALIGCQLEYDPEHHIYVRRNAYGKVYLRVANALNPGTFPSPAESNEAFKTPGVALILTLPTVIPAPRAMDEMIRIARRLAQRLDARLYDERRSRLSESDLRQMRTAALDFVSQPVGS